MLCVDGVFLDKEGGAKRERNLLVVNCGTRIGAVPKLTYSKDEVEDVLHDPSSADS